MVKKFSIQKTKNHSYKQKDATHSKRYGTPIEEIPRRLAIFEKVLSDTSVTFVPEQVHTEKSTDIKHRSIFLTELVPDLDTTRQLMDLAVFLHRTFHEVPTLDSFRTQFMAQIAVSDSYERSREIENALNKSLPSISLKYGPPESESERLHERAVRAYMSQDFTNLAGKPKH